MCAGLGQKSQPRGLSPSSLSISYANKISTTILSSSSSWTSLSRAPPKTKKTKSAGESRRTFSLSADVFFLFFLETTMETHCFRPDFLSLSLSYFRSISPSSSPQPPSTVTSPTSPPPPPQTGRGKRLRRRRPRRGHPRSKRSKTLLVWPHIWRTGLCSSGFNSLYVDPLHKSFCPAEDFFHLLTVSLFFSPLLYYRLSLPPRARLVPIQKSISLRQLAFALSGYAMGPDRRRVSVSLSQAERTTKTRERSYPIRCVCDCVCVCVLFCPRPPSRSRDLCVRSLGIRLMSEAAAARHFLRPAGQRDAARTRGM